MQGCVTYTMSAANVSFSTGNSTGYAVGDHATLYVTGTTTLTAAPVGGSYRIYTLSGHNGASGVLTDVLSLPSSGHFALKVQFMTCLSNLVTVATITVAPLDCLLAG